jgi:hypothetical protein
MTSVRVYAHVVKAIDMGTNKNYGRFNGDFNRKRNPSRGGKGIY